MQLDYDLITLCYVLKYFREFVLKIFSKVYDISTGFCSVQNWTNAIQKRLSILIQDIHDDTFFNETFYTYNFDFEQNYEKLFKNFLHMSLFLLCLHFLRCRRSCDRKANYCKICSRVRDNDFYDIDKFSNVTFVSYPSYLDILSKERVDFDIFLCKRTSACCSLCHPDSSDKKCANFEVFNFARDLFAVFCSVLVRMYFNYTLQYFPEFISNVSLSHEKKIINKIFKYAYDFLSKFFDVNHWFFYEFFNLFDKVNGSDCYVVYDNKPKYGHIMDQKEL